MRASNQVFPNSLDVYTTSLICDLVLSLRWLLRLHEKDQTKWRSLPSFAQRKDSCLRNAQPRGPTEILLLCCTDRVFTMTQTKFTTKRGERSPLPHDKKVKLTLDPPKYHNHTHSCASTPLHPNSNKERKDQRTLNVSANRKRIQTVFYSKCHNRAATSKHTITIDNRRVHAFVSSRSRQGLTAIQNRHASNTMCDACAHVKTKS